MARVALVFFLPSRSRVSVFCLNQAPIIERSSGLVLAWRVLMKFWQLSANFLKAQQNPTSLKLMVVLMSPMSMGKYSLRQNTILGSPIYDMNKNGKGERVGIGYLQEVLVGLAGGDGLEDVDGLLVKADHDCFNALQCTPYYFNNIPSWQVSYQIMNKLDLIFEKQPPEVQRKLMNLLIQYNAMMQYNANQDKFQVDLLLPFKTAQQKKEFIENFKSRSHKHNTHRGHPKQQNFSTTHRTEPHTAPTHRQKPDKVEPEPEKQAEEIREEPLSPERSDQSEISYELTNENYELSERRKTLSVRDISSIIKDKLQIAVHTIQQQSRPPDSHQDDNTKSSFKLNRVKMQSHQQQGMQPQDPHQYQAPTNTHNTHRRESWDKQHYDIQILGQEGSDPNQPHRISHQANSNESSEIKNQILIEDLSSSQNHDEGQRHQKSEHEPVQQGNFSIPSLPLNSRSFKSYLESSRQQLQKQRVDEENKNVQKSNESESLKNVKQKLADKYGSRKAANPNIRQKYSEFLKKNHRDFDRIYETIRKEIKRNDTKLVKSRRQDPILVLEQNIADAQSEEDRIFKEEIIKDYQKQIVVHHENMSSEDLVRYFRYLLQNAKSLYVKHIRKGK